MPLLKGGICCIYLCFMDSSLIYSIGIPILVMGLIFFFMLRYKKKEPLTYAEYFLKDKNPNYLHVLGAKRIIPEDGDSFDIFEHFVFDANQLRFIKGEGQRGKDLDLDSEFVKRNLRFLGEKLNVRLELIKQGNEENLDDEHSEILKIYRFDDDQSDTEVYDELDNNNITFIKRNLTNRDRFTMIICRHGRELKRYEMKGDSEYFFKSIYLDNRLWFCFLYRKQRGVYNSGVGLCILNYETGELVYDGLVRPS